MVAYTSPGGIIVQNAVDEGADTQSILKGMLDGSRGGKGLNLQTVPQFASYAALSNAYTPTSATTPAFAEVVGGKKYQWVGGPYNLWAPLPGYKLKRTIAGRTDATPTVDTAPDTYGITQVVTLPQFAWPVLYEFYFRARVNGSVATDQVQVYSKLNGAGQGYFLVVGSGSAISITSIVNEGTGQGAAATTFEGGIEKLTGTGTTTVSSGDPRFTSVDVLITPYYEEAEF